MKRVGQFGPWVIAAAAIGLALARSGSASAVREDSQTIVESLERVAKISTVDVHVADYRVSRDSKKLFGFLPVNCEKALVSVFHGKVGVGFDLTNGALTIDIQRETRRAIVHLPPPKVLYVDARAPDIVAVDGSICNSFIPADAKRLDDQARAAIANAAIAKGALDVARRQARELLQGVAQGLGYQVTVEIAPNPTAAAARE